MTRTTLWALRGIAIAAFITFTAMILLNVSPLAWRVIALVQFAVATRNLISWLIHNFLIMIVLGFGVLLQGNPIAIQTATSAYFTALGFSVPAGMDVIVLAFGDSLYHLGFQLLLLVAVLAGFFSFLRISGRLTSVCFISMMSIAILAAAAPVLEAFGISGVYFADWSTDPQLFLNPALFFGSPAFVMAMVCYIYLEASYQVAYFYELLEPPTLREEQLRRQLTKLRSDAERDVPVQHQEVSIPKALQRMLGSDAFRIMREVVEKKLLRREWLVELEEVHEIRRLNSYVDRLFRVDSEAELALTARGAAPSFSRMAGLSILSTLLRIIGITLVSFFCFYPVLLLGISAPEIIRQSVDFLFLTERTILLLVPLCLLFPLSATIISRIRQRREQPPEQTTAQS